MLIEKQLEHTYTHIFDQRAKQYHEAMEKYPLAREKEFLNVLQYADVQDGHIVFDFPSAGGYLVPFLAYNANVVALDPVEAFSDITTPVEGMKRVYCKNGIIPYRDCTADRVISISSAHLMPDLKEYFNEIKRVTKLAGIFSFADVHEDSNVARFLKEFVHPHSSLGYKGQFVNDKTQQLIESVGLVITFAQRISFPWKFPSIEAMVEFCTLLFGIDNASAKDVEEALQYYLGVQKVGKDYFLRWELMFYRATRVRL